MTSPTEKETTEISTEDRAENPAADSPQSDDQNGGQPKEYGGQDGPEPTRYGDWEKNGIISDF